MGLPCCCWYVESNGQTALLARTKPCRCKSRIYESGDLHWTRHLSKCNEKKLKEKHLICLYCSICDVFINEKANVELVETARMQCRYTMQLHKVTPKIESAVYKITSKMTFMMILAWKSKLCNVEAVQSVWYFLSLCIWLVCENFITALEKCIYFFSCVSCQILGYNCALMYIFLRD